MKCLNILSLVQAYESLQEESYASFLSFYGIEMKDEEIKDLASLIKVLNDNGCNKNIFNHFYVGYKIPQINKEFDLLRFGIEYIINIELKSTATLEKIEKQLRRNKYYLSFLDRQIHYFCFRSDTEELFYLDDNDDLKNTDFKSFIKLLEEQKLDNISNIDNLFNPSNYLVSPFNSTEKFINDEYFLTNQQEKIKSEILKEIETRKKASFMSIVGSAGTGKTLLTYDIAKEFRISGKKCLVIHCGLLNDGHYKLINEHMWEIISIKHYYRAELSEFELIIIDEAQRIKNDQLEKIVEKIKSVNGCCLFSYDKSQTLAGWEEKRNIDDCINNIGSVVTHKLTEKIRTNKEISLFMKALFNSRLGIKKLTKDNIQFNYFNNIEDAKEYLGVLENQEWEVLRFTPSQYDEEHHKKYSDFSHKTSHSVIGQEFENVVITIDSFFYYNEDGELSYRASTYYDAAKMLFQNITRTRKRLNVVIINNETILDRCISIFER